MRKATYDIVNCCGIVVRRIECELPDNIDPDDTQAKNIALEAANFNIIGRCYIRDDPAYRAQFVKVVEATN